MHRYARKQFFGEEAVGRGRICCYITPFNEHEKLFLPARVLILFVVSEQNKGKKKGVVLGQTKAQYII